MFPPAFAVGRSSAAQHRQNVAAMSPAVIASIPSPDSSTLELGPLSIHFYGLTLLVAIAAAVLVTGIRWTRRGGDWDLIFRCAVWGVAFGIVGARLYHVITSWDELPDEWWGPFAIWKGGLGVWGGIGLGTIVGMIVARRSGANVAQLADCVAPGLLVAQAIGRVGNWWNQELFGKPTDLPWALEIDPENRPVEYVDRDTFHPTFLYEGFWCLAAAGLLLVIERRFRIRPGGLFALYVLIYSVGRLWIETLRVDPSHELGGIRLNVFVAAVAIVLSGAFFVWWQRRWKRGGGPPPKVEAMAIPRERARP
jgi:prolipoprotein diacylglyceryl transferase